MLGLFGPKSGKIGVYKGAFIYQGPFKEGFSAGSPVINEVVLGTSVNKGERERPRLLLAPALLFILLFLTAYSFNSRKPVADIVGSRKLKVWKETGLLEYGSFYRISPLDWVGVAAPPILVTVVLNTALEQ
jgi:hypothetical protein